MFDRKYIVKIYLEGQNAPQISFVVHANYISVKGHDIHVDGVVLAFADNQYITVERG